MLIADQCGFYLGSAVVLNITPLPPLSLPQGERGVSRWLAHGVFTDNGIHGLVTLFEFSPALSARSPLPSFEVTCRCHVAGAPDARGATRTEITRDRTWGAIMRGIVRFTAKNRARFSCAGLRSRPASVQSDWRGAPVLVQARGHPEQLRGRAVKVYRITFATVLVAFLHSTSVYADNLYRAREIITGRQYNQALTGSTNRNFSISVGVGGEKDEYIVFQGETGLGDAVVLTKISDELKTKLEKAVQKAIAWSEVARKNKADTNKSLGCFGRWDERCEHDGKAYDENEMGLSFFAANEGRQTDLVITIIDLRNRFFKATIHLDPDEMKKLLQAVQAIDGTLKKARDKAKKQDLFK